MARTKPLMVADHAPSLQTTGTSVAPIINTPEEKPKLNLIEREPVQFANGMTALVAAIAVLVRPWLDVSDEQQLAIVTVIGIIGPLVAGFYARSKVTPVAKLQ